jgi:tetratricopeptide (TPR) repeat protein
MHSLAWAYSAQGNHAEALALGLEVVEARRRELGPDHPRTLASANSMVSIYLRAGRLEEAEDLAEDCVRRFRKVYGDVHLRTEGALSRLASAYTRQGKYDWAENVRRELLDLLGAHYGEEHPRTLQAMHNVGLNLYNQGSHEAAVPILEDTLQKRRAVLGDADTNTLWTMTMLSAALSYRDHSEEAAVLAREALVLIDRDHDGQHSGRFTLMESIADCLPEDDVSEDDRAILAEHLSERKIKSEASDAPSWAKNLYAWYLLTTPARELRDPKAALEVALEANEMDGHSEPWHLDTLALAYHETGNSRKAVEIQRGALLLVPEDDADMRAELEHRMAEFEEALKRDSVDSP